jgi:membrane-bound ClpP family serine protease
VADYTFVVVGILMAFIIIMILMVRMITIIQPGQLGLVFLLGAYITTANPGFNIVSPLARVVKITAGSGPNGALGMVGVADSNLGPDRPPGPVRIGDRTVPARSTSALRPGDQVRVIEDTSLGVVLVAKERSRPGLSASANPR